MYRNGGKRILDVLFAVIGLVLLCPLLIGLTIVIAISLRDYPFFIQRRPGRYEQLFWLVKFKTMNNRLDDSGNLFPDAIRLTRLGRWLRRTSLDELPQLWNVLKGDMSLVGPRPLLPEYLPLYSEAQHQRHTVRPGLTGWAQVNGRNAISWSQKFAYDQWYINHLGLRVDLKILFLTIVKILKVVDESPILGEKFIKTD